MGDARLDLITAMFRGDAQREELAAAYVTGKMEALGEFGELLAGAQTAEGLASAVGQRLDAARAVSPSDARQAGRVAGWKSMSDLVQNIITLAAAAEATEPEPLPMLRGSEVLQ